MLYCKDFNSLSILSLYEGELLGVVDKLYFDKKIKKLCEIELLGEDGVKLILSTKNIYRVGKNAITVKNNQAVELRENKQDFCIAPLGSKAYSINGEFLGVVQEIAINEKYQTQKILLDNGQVLEIEDIATSGKNTLIFYNQANKVNLKQFTPKRPKDLKRKLVQMAEVQPVEQPKLEPEKVETKIASNQDTNFLIGRICTKDIYNFNNELLIKANSLVNKKNIKEINKYGRLRELMLYSK